MPSPFASEFPDRVIPCPSPRAIVDFTLIRGLVKRGLDKVGEFPVLESRPRCRRAAEGSRPRAARHVCKALENSLPRRGLTSEMLLPEGSEEKIDAGFTGTLGAFEIYRGASRGHRMANLRVVLR
jgi:hypothetical protein